jgi:hypothetical protein
MQVLIVNLLLFDQILFLIIEICGRNDKKQTVNQNTLLIVMWMCKCTEYSYSVDLYLLVLTVRDISNTGAQIYLLVY